MEMITFPDSYVLPIPTDFDPASIVNGKIDTRSPAEDLLDGESDITRQAGYYLNKLKDTFSTEQIIKSMDLFESKKVDLETALGDFPLDEVGRALAEEHIAGCYRALSLLFADVSRLAVLPKLGILTENS